MKAARSLTRIRTALALAGVAFLIALGVLLGRSLDAAREQQTLRREAVAERVFDALEADLAELLATEEARPFVQWRHEWVPSGAAGTEASPTRSPLAELPERPYVLGYFQIEPDGTFATPLADDGSGSGSGSSPEVVARVDLLRELNDDLVADNRLAVANIDRANVDNEAQREQQLRAYDEPPVQQQAALPDDVQIQRALNKQSKVKQARSAEFNRNAFNADLDQLSNFLEGSSYADAPAAPDALDVRTTPFVGEAIGDRLRLVRTVEIGEERWIQGVVLDRAGLEDWLEARLLDGSLEGYLALTWGDEAGETDPRAGRWSHRFAEPFAELRVQVDLGATTDSGAPLILGLGVGLVLALVVGLLAVERSLAAMVARAEERERFIAAVTHELRTPLTSIRMYSEMLEQGMVGEPERQRHYHSTIRGEAERLSRLVEQVLTLAQLAGARPGEGGGEPAREPIADVVDRVVTVLEPQAREADVGVDVQLDGEVATWRLPGDALTQVLTNLLDNAIKFGGAGKPVELRGQAEGGGVRLRVRDRGPGVEAAELARIFEAFARGRRADEDAVRGTGIGLALVRSLVESQGGEIVGRNRDGGGFEVSVWLPRAA